MTHRSRNLAVVLGALTAGACSVYGPGDLPTDPGGGAGGTINGGKGGGGGSVTWGGGGLGTGGNDGMGGHTTEEGGQADGAGAGGAAGTGASGASGASSGGSASPNGGSTSGGGGTSGGVAGSGSGGTTVTAGGKAAGGNTSGGAPPAVPPELIDNMEDTNGQLYVQDDRTGYWYTSADTTNGGSVTPTQGTSITMAELPSGDVGAGGGSTTAFHFSGVGGPSPSWGALGGFDLVASTGSVKHSYNAHLYKGIHFFAKAGATVNVAVRLPIRDTTLNAESAKCSGANCDDHWSRVQRITTSWAAYDLLWPTSGNANNFAQGGWGLAATFDATTLVGVQFVLTSGISGDIWVDDISFIPI